MHARALEGVAAEVCDDDGKRSLEEGGFEVSGTNVTIAADENGESDRFERLEDGFVGVVVNAGIDDEAVESVVVGVLFDIVRSRVIRVWATDGVSESSGRGGSWSSCSVDSSECDKRPVDAVAGDAVVRTDVTRVGTRRRKDDRSGDSRLVHLSLESIRGTREVPSAGRRPIRWQSRIDVDDAKSVFEFQHPCRDFLADPYFATGHEGLEWRRLAALSRASNRQTGGVLERNIYIEVLTT